ncbi:MAG: LON peptidase substrate-binding domain-containing protein [Bacteroidia bacterium]
MKEFLPMFPLSLVVFPGERLRLHVFEPRYKQLLRECIDEGATFGIPVVIEQSVASIATEVRLASVQRTYPGGEADIVVEGLQRVEISNFHRISPGKLYPGGEVNWLSNYDDPEFEVQETVIELLENFYRILGMNRSVDSTSASLRAYQVGHKAGLNIQQEYQLLTFDRERDRLRFIRDHLRRIIPVVEEAERLKVRAKLNGHFKNVVPPNF